MKILVFSDSHGKTLGMYDALEREQPDAVIHLGDYAEDADLLRRSYPNLTVWGVRGNNDYGADAALSAVIAPEGVPLYLTHGHMERVTWTSVGVLPKRAREAGCAVALFGHTHRVHQEEAGGVLLLNPGSISLPRGGPPSYARLVFEKGRLEQVSMLEENGGPYKPRKRRIGWI